jgi:hypothetical protein
MRRSENYDLASRMVDLDVDLSPELTKASHSSASTSAYFQASHVITTRDVLEEFVAADIWPCQPQWGSWACLGWITMCEAQYSMLSVLMGRQTRKSLQKLREMLFK